MGFFTVKTDEESVKDYAGGGNYINKSGIYEVLIKHVIVDTSPKGSQYLNLHFEYNGQEQMIYQALRLTNNDGSPNLEAQLFNKLLIIIGGSEGMTVNDPVPMDLPVGKGKEMKECMVLEDIADVPVLMRVQMEYSMWEGKIQEKKIIRNFFDITSHATASEIVNNSETKGKQYEKELEYADKITYKNDLTPEDVEAWIKSRSSNKGKDDTPAVKETPSFGQKRSFSRK